MTRSPAPSGVPEHRSSCDEYASVTAREFSGAFARNAGCSVRRSRAYRSTGTLRRQVALSRRIVPRRSGTLPLAPMPRATRRRSPPEHRKSTANEERRGVEVPGFRACEVRPRSPIDPPDDLTPYPRPGRSRHAPRKALRRESLRSIAPRFRRRAGRRSVLGTPEESGAFFRCSGTLAVIRYSGEPGCGRLARRASPGAPEHRDTGKEGRED